MNFKLPLIAVMVGALSLSACGGGSSSSGSTVTADSPASLVITDVKLGTGATVANGSNVTINYATYLYKASAADFKGALIDPGQPLQFTVGAGKLIPGVEVGIVGMKVGGQRTLLIPAAQAYGGRTDIPGVPPNSGLVFDMTLTVAQ